MKNYIFISKILKFLNRIFRHCVGGTIQSVQQRVRIRLLKRLKRSICHVTSDIKQSITHNRLVLHYSRSVKRCYGYYRLVLRGATLCFPIIEVCFVPSDRPSVSKYHPSSQVFLEAAGDMYAVHGTLDSDPDSPGRTGQQAILHVNGFLSHENFCCNL